MYDGLIGRGINKLLVRKIAMFSGLVGSASFLTAGGWFPNSQTTTLAFMTLSITTYAHTVSGKYSFVRGLFYYIIERFT